MNLHSQYFHLGSFRCLLGSNSSRPNSSFTSRTLEQLVRLLLSWWKEGGVRRTGLFRVCAWFYSTVAANNRLLESLNCGFSALNQPLSVVDPSSRLPAPLQTSSLTPYIYIKPKHAVKVLGSHRAELSSRGLVLVISGGRRAHFCRSTNCGVKMPDHKQKS